MLSKELIKNSLLQIIDNIDSGNSEMSEEDQLAIVKYANEITNTKNKLSKYQACKYLNISRATFDNWVKAGKLPKGKKEQGFKELFWELNALKKIKKQYKII